MSVTYSEPVFIDLVSSMQRSRAILPSLACPALKYFFQLSHKRHDFRKEVIKHKMCILIFSTTSV